MAKPILLGRVRALNERVRFLKATGGTGADAFIGLDELQWLLECELFRLIAARAGTYAHASYMGSMHLRVIDVATGDEMKDVLEVDTEEGWAIVHPAATNPKRITGKFRLERRDEAAED